MRLTLGLWWRGDVSAASADWRWRLVAAAPAARRRRPAIPASRRRPHHARLRHRLPRGSNTPGRCASRSERLASLAMPLFIFFYLWSASFEIKNWLTNVILRHVQLLYSLFFVIMIFLNKFLSWLFISQNVKGVGFYFIFFVWVMVLGFVVYCNLKRQYNVPSMCACLPAEWLSLFFCCGSIMYSCKCVFRYITLKLSWLWTYLDEI